MGMSDLQFLPSKGATGRSKLLMTAGGHISKLMALFKTIRLYNWNVPFTISLQLKAPPDNLSPWWWLEDPKKENLHQILKGSIGMD